MKRVTQRALQERRLLGGTPTVVRVGRHGVIGGAIGAAALGTTTAHAALDTTAVFGPLFSMPTFGFSE